MQIEKTLLPPLTYQQDGNLLSPFSCDRGPAKNPGPYVLNVVVTNGAKVDKPAGVLPGNFIDALPYHTSILSWTNNPWTANVHYEHPVQFINQEGNWEYCTRKARTTASFDGRYLAALSGSPPLRSIDNALVSRTVRYAEVKAKANLRKGLMNIPLLLAERLQTVQMAKERVGDMMRVVESVHKRDFTEWKKLKSARSRKAFAQKAASSHLELIFGWLPLIDEIESALKVIENKDYMFRVGKGRMTEVLPEERRIFYPDATKLFPFATPGGLQQPFVCREVIRRTVSSRCSLRADIDISFLANASILGFNPIGVAYDLVPLSFISGWFSNFNNYVESLDPLIGATFRTGSNSIRIKHHLVRDIQPNSNGSSSKEKPRCSSSGAGKYESLDQTTVRQVLSSEPDSEFFWENNFSTYSVLASISLFLQKKLKTTNKVIFRKQFRIRQRKPINLPPIRYTGSTK